MPDYPKVPQQISDPISENLAKLAELFPTAVKDGALDVEALRAELGDFEEIKPGDETYELNWVGKQAAKKEAFKPLLGKTLSLKDDGKNSETTQNIYIEGDNLEALKLLRQNYYGEVKMIYIDPPYNTGKDFVYTDKFAVKSEESEQEEGSVSEGGQRLVKNEKSSNRFHARWLDMIYPRLKLAKDLLRDDGVIFISIDDNEVANLRGLCDEVFGDDNFIAQIIWQRSKKGDSKFVAVVHEYLLCYTRNRAECLARGGVWRKEKEGVRDVLAYYETLKSELNDHSMIRQQMLQYYKSLPKSDPRSAHSHYCWSDDRGLYFAADFAGPDDGRASRPRHDIFHPVTGKPCKKPSTGWRWDEAKTAWALAETPPRIHFGPDETTIPNRKSYLSEISSEPYSSVFYQDGRSATLEVESLVGKGLFSFPKNKEVVGDLISLVCNTSDLILDFFSGSATTAHAVMQLNAKDGGNRRYIMVQLPEVCDVNSEAAKAGYKTISEIGKERVRRAGEKIKEELKAKHAEWQKQQAPKAKKGGKLALNEDDDGAEDPNPYVLDPDSLDIGFKSFRIEETRINWLKKDLRGEQLEFSDTTTQDALDFVPGYTDTDVVYELMLRQSNIPLTGTITKPIASAKRTYLYADAYLVCLEEKITQKLVESLASIEPTPNKYFFRDSAFGTDIALKDETFRRLKAEIHKHHGDLGAAYTVEFI